MSGQVRSGQVMSVHVLSGQDKSGQFRSCQVMSYHVMSGRVSSGQVISFQVRSTHVRWGQSRSCQVMSCQVRSCRVMSCHVRSGQVMLSCIILYYIIILWDHRRICGPSFSETSLCGAWIYQQTTCGRPFKVVVSGICLCLQIENCKLWHKLMYIINFWTNLKFYSAGRGVLRGLVGYSFGWHTARVETAVAQRLGRCATNREVAGSFPAGVCLIFHWYKILLIAIWPCGRLSL